MKRFNSKVTYVKGFTLVELLVVIVIIAILAAIVVVAYNGIQTRARDQQSVTAIDSYVKGLLSYAVIHGAYPDGTNSSCLGENYPSNQCSVGGVYNVDTTFNNNLRTVMGQLPMPDNSYLSYFSETRDGAAFAYIYNATLDGAAAPYGITYMLPGTVACENAKAVGINTGSGWPNFITQLAASGATEQSNGNTLCRLVLPDPTTL
jgi:prepilin-type N-terminal cleavage/methylation domain-containing protein